jgi:hypothetical protein
MWYCICCFKVNLGEGMKSNFQEIIFNLHIVQIVDRKTEKFQKKKNYMGIRNEQLISNIYVYTKKVFM